VLALALAILAGVALFPVFLVFPPVYFPWTLLVETAAGAIAGLAIPQVTDRWGARVGLTAAAVVGAAVLTLVLSRNVVLTSIVASAAAVSWWLAWIGIPVLVGTLAGGLARRRLGALAGTATVAIALVAIAAAGMGLAVALAPRDVATAPSCDRDPRCPRMSCWMTAERRRLFAVESITAYDGSTIECTYTAWGGIRIGMVSGGVGRGSGWTDADWPMLLAPRSR
jgi:hypothetical protein